MLSPLTGGKEDQSHGQEGAKLGLAHLTPGPCSEAQAICPTVSRPCAERFLLELTVNQENGWIHGKPKGRGWKGEALGGCRKWGAC